MFVCGCCGELFETADRKQPGNCPHCGCKPPLQHTAKRNKATCKHCDHPVRYPGKGVPQHRLFAIEYHCECHSQRAGKAKGRLFKAPDRADLDNYAEAARRLQSIAPSFIPDDVISRGYVTERLLRLCFRHFVVRFNARQLLGLELSCRWIAGKCGGRVQEALATNLSDLTRYQNMLCRYDTMALKSLDVFSVHGFPIGLIQCESNLLGITGKNGAPVGSGGWLNITEKFSKAKRYCSAPFEVRHDGLRKTEVPIVGEWIGMSRNGCRPPEEREIQLTCADSASSPKDGPAFDAVFTDPPYFGNVQYAELMDFCYVWLRKLMDGRFQEFSNRSTRHHNELTGNTTMGRGLDHFAEGISATLRRSVENLKPGRPLAFTYHHNQLDAYLPLAVALFDAGLVCSASLPCPAEMGASIHINGTGSSIVDTVFVCRSTGSFPKRWLAHDAKGVAPIIQEDLKMLADGGLKATQGDIRCICCGHLTRLAIWNLRSRWDAKIEVSKRMGIVQRWFCDFGGLGAVLEALESNFASAERAQRWDAGEVLKESHDTDDEISF